MQPPARPLSLTVSFHFSWSNVLIFNYTYIGFTSSYTIHALYIYELFYIPILYLFYTHILHFYTVLYFNKNIYDPTSYFTLALFAWGWTFQDITRVSLSRINWIWSLPCWIRNLLFSANCFLYGIITAHHPTPRAFWLFDIMSICHESDGDRIIWWIFQNISQAGLVDYHQYYWIILEQNTSVYFKMICFTEKWVPENLPEHQHY